VAKPSRGFFGDFFGKIGELVQSIEDTYNAVVANVDVLLNLKATVQSDFAQLVVQLKELTASQQAFVDRAKHLKSHLVRADVIFEFIDEIRTGELKKFCVDQIGTLHSTLTDTLDQLAAVGGQRGSFLTARGVFVIQWIRKIILVWAVLGVMVDTLKGIVPVVEAFKNKLEKFEDVILPQTNPRFRLKKTISARQGKLHAST
jgi:hypothetical protein